MDDFLSSLVSVAFHGLAYGMILYAISGRPVGGRWADWGFVNLAHGRVRDGGAATS